MIQTYIVRIGAKTLSVFQTLTKYLYFITQTLVWLIRPPSRLKLILSFMHFVGNQSLTIVSLSGLFTGAVLGLQSGVVFQLFKTEAMMGAVTAKSLALELAPILSSFIVAARVGSAMAAEIATMRVSEQIDALLVMGVHPLSYLVLPRIVASILVLPFLSLSFLFWGILGCYGIGSVFFDLNTSSFFHYIRWLVSFDDTLKGLVKCLVFGFIFSSISTFFGFFSSGGAHGVGEATTRSVVTSLFSILIFDFIISFIQIYW